MKTLRENNQWITKKGFSLIELMVVIAIIAILASISLPIYYNYTCHAQAQESLGALKSTKASWAALRSVGRFNEPGNDYTTSVRLQDTLSVELPIRNWSYTATNVVENEVTLHVVAIGTGLKECLISPPLGYDFTIRYETPSGGTRTGVTFHVLNTTDRRFIKNRN